MSYESDEKSITLRLHTDVSRLSHRFDHHPLLLLDHHPGRMISWPAASAGAAAAPRTVVGVLVEGGVLNLADRVHLGLGVEGAALRRQEELEVLVALLLPVPLRVSVDLAGLAGRHPLTGELLAAPENKNSK